jgi:enoyl-CoA hydratase/carnithine racemase
MGARIEHDGEIAIVVLDWPEQRNAIGPEEATEITARLDEVATSATRGLVVTGQGAFCAGGNMKGAAARTGMPSEERRRLVYRAYHGLFLALGSLPVPTCAAVDGPAVGMGMDLALACDSTFVGPDGWLRQGWGRVGLIPGTGGELLLRRRAPNVLWRLLDQQPRLDASAAESLGIAEAAAAGSTARDAALGRLHQLAKLPRATVEGYVTLNRLSGLDDYKTHLARCLEIQIGLLADPEFRKRAEAALG